jgi:hypothetical protein
MVIPQWTGSIDVPPDVAEELKRDDTSAYGSSLVDSPAPNHLVTFVYTYWDTIQRDIRFVYWHRYRGLAAQIEILGDVMLVPHESEIERLLPRVECDQWPRRYRPQERQR